MNMAQHTFVIHKQLELLGWVVENKDGETIKKSYHTALRRAVIDVLRRIPRKTQVFLTIVTEDE